MLLPFNVERPTRRVPVCTYALIGANVLIYLLTILVANVQLASDRPQFRQQVAALAEMNRYQNEETMRAEQTRAAAARRDSSGQTPSSEEQPLSGEQSFAPGGHAIFPSSIFPSPIFLNSISPNRVVPNRASSDSLLLQSARSQIGGELPTGKTLPTNPNGANLNGANPNGADSFGDDAPALPPTAETLELARSLESPETGKKVGKDALVRALTYEWDAQHDRDLFVLEPHPTTLAWLAYWVGAPTLLGFFASMFLHSGLEHLLGNMLFLWVFGRALEDALGAIVYSMAYLVCGIAASLLFHFATVSFTPEHLLFPAMGASGAISGLLGLFAPRFYRTPIKVFYTKWVTSFFFLSGGTIFWMGSLILGHVFAQWVGSAGYVLGGLAALAALIVWGEDELWGEWKVPAAWGIAAYFVWNDVLMFFFETAMGARGGVAHWAHIGGFFCGVFYAFVVGLTGDAKSEYITDAAEDSIKQNHGHNATQSAQQLLRLKPNDPNAHRLMARALDAKNESDKALDFWESAIEKFLQIDDRDGAAKSYLEAVSKHRTFILVPRTQFLLGNHLARSGDYLGAAETLVKIPYTFPDAPEGELSLLRSAQLYAQHLHNPTLARQLLTLLLERYPHTEWRAQVEQGLKSIETTVPPKPQALEQTGYAFENGPTTKIKK